MARTVVIGDVHGCVDELDALLERVAFTAADRLVFVGDLVVRGPFPAEVLATARRHRALAVRGNHEDRLLRLRAAGGASSRSTPSTEASSPARPSPAPSSRRLALGAQLARAAAALSDADWAYLEAMPLWRSLPAHALLVVHAGLLPGVAIEAQSARHLLYLRGIDDDGRPTERRDEGTPWGARYVGPPHVVFGHNAQPEPQLHPAATGIDTGCVYGGALTALVLADGERVRPLPERRDQLVSVPARRAYVPIHAHPPPRR